MFGWVFNHCHIEAREVSMLATEWIRIPLQCPKVFKVKKKNTPKVTFLTPIWKKDFIAVDIWSFLDHPTDGTWAVTVLSVNTKTKAPAFQQYEFFRLYYFVSLRQEAVLLGFVCAEWVIRDKCAATPRVQYVQIPWTSRSCCATQAAKCLSWTIDIC